MKIYKKIIGIFLILSSISQASWWGNLHNGERAAIIIGSALLMNNSYQNSEIKHRENLKNIDTQIRRDYEVQRTVEEAHKKYSNKNKTEEIYIIEKEIRNPIAEYIKNPGLGKIVYSDEKTALIELNDGTRFMIEKRYLK